MRKLVFLLSLLCVTCLNAAFVACNKSNARGEPPAQVGSEISGSESESSEESSQPAVYTISVYDGSKLLKTYQTEEGGEYSIPASEKAGYAFEGYKDGTGASFALTGTLAQNATVYASYSLLETTTFAQLAERAAAGADRICITQDIEIEDTVYIVDKTVIYTEGEHTLLRSPSFLGEMFVVGETPAGENILFQGKSASLTLQTENGGRLTLDGNKAQISEPVHGSAILIINSGTVNLQGGVTVKNCKKTGNEKILGYEISNPLKAGGAAVLVENGTLNVDGAEISDNEATREELSTEEDTSLNGGAIFNYGTVNIYNGVLKNNQAARGGAIYNYRTVRIEGGEISDNQASVYGGAIYLADSQYAVVYLGQDTEQTVVTLANNQANKSGGVIFSGSKTTVNVYGGCLFEDNKSLTSNGGAMNVAGVLLVEKSTFKNNLAASKGGAIYLYVNDSTLTVRLASIEDSLFESNYAGRGGAIAVSASEDTYPKGANATIKNTRFLTNAVDRAKEVDSTEDFNGGALYISRKSEVVLSASSFCENTAEAKGGAVYVTGGSSLTVNGQTAFEKNQSTDNGGAIYAYTATEDIQTARTVLTVDGASFTQNATASESYGGGALYIRASLAQISSASFTKNTSKYNGGAVAGYSGATISLENVSFSQNEATKHGAGLYLNDGEATVQSTAFTDNVAAGNGGGMYAAKSTSRLEGCAFTSNVATGNGGGMYAYTDAVLELQACTFTTNTAENGGGMYLTGAASVDLYGFKAIGNAATKLGGAIYITTTDTTLNIYSAGSADVGEGEQVLPPVRENVAPDGGGVLWSNTSKTIINVDSQKFPYTDGFGYKASQTLGELGGNANG